MFGHGELQWLSEAEPKTKILARRLPIQRDDSGNKDLLYNLGQNNIVPESSEQLHPPIENLPQQDDQNLLKDQFWQI